MPANPIPQGYETVTPYLCCKDAKTALKFYEEAFGATRTLFMPMPDGRVGHAEIRIGNGIIMVSDEFPEMGNVSPDTLGGTTGSLMIYVKDVDAFVAHAVSKGAEIIKPLTNQFYGDRNCKLKDPAGHVWFFATHVEDVSPEEMDRRMASFCEGEKK